MWRTVLRVPSQCKEARCAFSHLISYGSARSHTAPRVPQSHKALRPPSEHELVVRYYPRTYPILASRTVDRLHIDLFPLHDAGTLRTHPRLVKSPYNLRSGAISSLGRGARRRIGHLSVGNAHRNQRGGCVASLPLYRICYGISWGTALVTATVRRCFKYEIDLRRGASVRIPHLHGE